MALPWPLAFVWLLLLMILSSISFLLSSYPWAFFLRSSSLFLPRAHVLFVFLRLTFLFWTLLSVIFRISWFLQLQSVVEAWVFVFLQFLLAFGRSFTRGFTKAQEVGHRQSVEPHWHQGLPYMSDLSFASAPWSSSQHRRPSQLLSSGLASCQCQPHQVSLWNLWSCPYFWEFSGLLDFPPSSF